MRTFATLFRLFLASSIPFLLTACGGGSPPSPSPPQESDFSVSVSPVSASAVLGNSTSPVTVSVGSKSGFNKPVNITLLGLPSGVNATPSSFALQPGAMQPVTFSVSGSVSPGEFNVTVAGASGDHSHNAQLILTTEPLVSVRTYQNGSVLYLESNSGPDTARVGLETLWGGSIVEVSLNGTNFVNMSDTGREVQVAEYDGNAQYDGCAGCTGTFGWNPVQGGDKYGHGSPVITQTVGGDSLFVKAQPIHWNPDDKGGGPGAPAPGDVFVDATITAVTDHAFTFKGHFKITHFGLDQHTNSIQEFPAVYTSLGFDRFATDSTTTPWTNAVVTFTTMPFLPAFGPTIYASEQWAAFVDSNDSGLTVFVPGMAPYVAGFAAAGSTGPSGTGTNYFAPRTYFSFGPNSVLEGDVYLVAGSYKHARQVIYDLHNHLPATDIFTPIGTLDSPAPNAQLSGTVNVRGWAFDDTAVSRVEVYVDGILAGTAGYGSERPDVANEWPHAPSAIGFSFSLDTSNYSNGSHTVEVRAVDTSGNVAVLPHASVTVQN